MVAVKVATFNVENLFSRPVAMDFTTWSQGQPILNDHHRLNVLFNQGVYSDQDKAEMFSLLKKYGLAALRPRNKYLELRKIRGQLIRYDKHRKPVEIAATGRGDWVGWVELKRTNLTEDSIRNTAQVIAEVDADVLTLVEVEDRPTLQRFHDAVLAPILQGTGKALYPFNMVIDGNDARGIDVGLLSRRPIMRMRSHIDHLTEGRPTFSRDCPEYTIALDNGKELVILPNHFASKGSDTDGTRRRVQAAAVKTIYDQLRSTQEYVIVSGDLNDYPASGALDALLADTDLKDAMALEKYQGYPGTYQHARAEQKLDYLLLSPGLAASTVAVHVNRRGFYAPTKWDCLDGITKWCWP